MRARGIPLLIGLLALLAAACGGSSKAADHKSVSVTAPSASAKMVCEAEAKQDIAAALGEQTRAPLAPTWRNSVYACTYAYADGQFTLSVKELSDAAATGTYFKDLGVQLKRRPDALAIGDAGFVAADGSVVVRKDFKVLTVDVAELPAQFGVPPRAKLDVAETVAATIMGCWTGG